LGNVDPNLRPLARPLNNPRSIPNDPNRPYGTVKMIIQPEWISAAQAVHKALYPRGPFGVTQEFINTATPVYTVAEATFATSTESAYAFEACRRMR
jgi:hypothetical protein